MLAAYIKLLRPKQYSKNLLVFAALLFTGNFSNIDQVIRALIAFLAMCMASSATYIINDLIDLERDRAHPVKKNRPIASGKVSPKLAIAIAALLFIGAVAIGVYLNKASAALIAFYAIMQAAYNIRLKHIAISDVFVISLGFILRATLGAAAVGVAISGWLLLCTGALALMLGFGKRRHEFLLQGDERGSSREVLKQYTLELLNNLVVSTATSAALCYAIYVMESTNARNHPLLIFTVIFVAYGVCRYLYLIFGKGEGGEPETLLVTDPHIWGTILGFVIIAVIAIKFPYHFPMVELSPK
ncbi:MAG: decaprenyl-phosphate phosphoribosyltransferase [Armatimonadetes bacterium]|nr:decaprenyl-phosphate phosphoribosyltransferase [Armatimonadota bacterium]